MTRRMFQSTRLLIEVLAGKFPQPEHVDTGSWGEERHYDVPGTEHTVIVSHSDETGDALGQQDSKNPIKLHSVVWDVNPGNPIVKHDDKRKVLSHGLRAAADTVSSLIEKNPRTVIHHEPASPSHRNIYKGMLKKHGMDWIDNGADIFAWKDKTGHEHDIRHAIQSRGYHRPTPPAYDYHEV